MIVTRHTVVVKSGRMQEVVALIRAERERIRSTGIGRAAARIYLPQIGPTSMVAWEVEYENLAEYEKSSAEWWASPGTAALMEKWFELVEPGGATEVWTLTE
jgi:hypothetical protein